MPTRHVCIMDACTHMYAQLMYIVSPPFNMLQLLHFNYDKLYYKKSEMEK